ncbi:unnamed protein product [Musa banksii]
MGQRWRSKGKTAPADEDEEAQSVISLGSSDDEEANEDLSLAIVEKARQREAKRKRSEDALGPVPAAETPAPAVRLSSVFPSSGVAELVSDRNPESSVGGLTSLTHGERKKKPKKSKKKQQHEVEEKKVLQIGAIIDEEQPPRKGESVIAEANGVSDNLVFRKLLMGESSTPRTFDNKNRSSRGTKSVPRDFGKGQRKKNLLYEERWNMTTGKSKIKGGWIVDDPGDLPRKKFRAHDYASPMTSRKKSHRNYSIVRRFLSWSNYGGFTSLRRRVRYNMSPTSTRGLPSIGEGQPPFYSFTYFDGPRRQPLQNFLSSLYSSELGIKEGEELLAFTTILSSKNHRTRSGFRSHPPTANAAERSARGLYYDEKWSIEHRCKQGQLMMIEPIGEEPKAKNVDSDLEGINSNEDVEPTVHTMHTLADYSNPQTMKVGGTLEHQPIIVLIDTGSTNNFIDSEIVDRLAHHIKDYDIFKDIDSQTYEEAIMSIDSGKTKDLLLIYGGNSLKVEGYTDSSFQFDVDDSKSNSRYVYTLNGGAVCWKSSKQDTTVDSTTEAEYIAASDAVKEGVWLKKFITDLGVVPGSEESTSLYCDNYGAITQIREPRSHQKSKHVLRRFHLIREIVTRGDVVVERVPSEDNIADPLTKPSILGLEGHMHMVGIAMSKGSNMRYPSEPLSYWISNKPLNY